MTGIITSHAGLVILLVIAMSAVVAMGQNDNQAIKDAVPAAPPPTTTPAPAKRIIVDFEDAKAVTLTPAQSEIARISVEGGQALQITTETAASYPGVLIQPRQGKWDLSGFDRVEMDVHNPQDKPVRVLLSLHNPGADGQKNCNTESATIPPRSKSTVVVPFGMWHGNPGHPIDQTNIVAVQIMLDRPGEAHRFIVDNIRAMPADRSHMEPILADPFFKSLEPPFGRGINLGNALEAPREGQWGVTLKEEYFTEIKKAGFDSVRIPVRWSAHAQTEPPFRIDEKFFERVDWAVQQSLDRGLIPVLNMHHYEEIFKTPDEHRERYLALWQQIAEHYMDFPAELALELLNEPHAKLTSEKWNSMLANALTIVRRTHPTRKIVIGPGGWNSINELESLQLPEADRNIIVTVHYYSPMQFTHQGAEWTGAEAQKWLGTKWTGTPAEQQAVRRDLDRAISWGVKHRRPIYLGEFGAYSKADMESRARWTRFVADEAMERKMGTAYWEFCSGFGAYNAKKNEWITPLKDALLGK